MNTHRRETIAGMPSPALFRSRSAGGARGWKRWGAAASFAGGLGIGLVGIALYALAGAAPEPAASELTIVGNVALLSLFPLLVVGAHCLDAIERELDSRKRDGVERTAKAGPDDEDAPPSRPDNVMVFRRHLTRGIGAIVLFGLGLGVQPAHVNVPRAPAHETRPGAPPER